MSRKTMILSRSRIVLFTTAKPYNMKLGFFWKNIKKYLKKNGLSPDKIMVAKQIHSSKFITVKNRKTKLHKKIDGFITPLKNVLLVVFTADCLPVMFFDREKSVIGLAHCGWRGTYKELAAKIVRAMKKQYKLKGKDIFVRFGPCILPCCYEVSKDLALKFTKKFGRQTVRLRGKKYYLGLPEAVKVQLKKNGIPEKNIKGTNECTMCDPPRYFSYRRDGKGTGRMATGIMISS
jgi:polyphenol oxidase